MERTKTFANRDVSNLIICDYNTGAPYINLDYANVSTADMTGETVYAYGGQGHPKKIAFSSDRGGTMTVECQVRETQLYKLISGAEIAKEQTDVTVAERVFVTLESTSKVFYLEKTPKTNTMKVYKNGVVVENLSLSGATSGDKYRVVVTGTGAGSLSNGDEIVVYYQRTIGSSNAEKLAITADTFPKAVIIYADTWDKATDDSIVEQKMIAYKAVAQPNFSLSNSNTGDPGTLTMTFDLMENGNHDILDLIFKNRA